MPKEAKKKYGNELDHLLERIEPPGELATPERWKKYSKEVTLKKFQTMFKLLDHYDIDPASRNPWFELAWRLAEDHVKAMRFSKKSRSAVWSWQTHLALYGLVETGRHKNIKIADLPKHINGTILSGVMKPDMSAKAISNEVAKFKKSDRGQMLLKMVDLIPDQNDRHQLWEDLLHGKVF